MILGVLGFGRRAGWGRVGLSKVVDVGKERGGLALTPTKDASCACLKGAGVWKVLRVPYRRRNPGGKHGRISGFRIDVDEIAMGPKVEGEGTGFELGPKWATVARGWDAAASVRMT